jgi:Uma2 family endonuclease
MSVLEYPLTLNLDDVFLTDEQFYNLCVNNPEMNIERSSKGVLIVMPPVGGESGNRESESMIDLGIWNRREQRGYVFSSSTVFKLPNGGDRSPDVSWVERSRWNQLTSDQKKKFPPIAPDFVLEIRSRTDKLSTLQEKMQEYLESGVRLGWLFNPQDQQVEIYRPQQTVEVRSLPTVLSGEEVLVGFELSMPLFVDL